MLEQQINQVNEELCEAIHVKSSPKLINYFFIC
jgi:hypothetical protein